MSSGVEIFGKEDFEKALDTTGLVYACNGVVHGQYEYIISFGNEDAFICLGSSIAPSGQSRDVAEDSIRGWIVGEDGKPLGKTKVGNYTTRRPGWQRRLGELINKLVKIGQHIKRCPKCDQVLLLAVRKGENNAYMFCREDSENRNNKEHVRHFPLATINMETGELEVSKRETARTCPTCGINLIKVKIRQGANAGKDGLTCPAKDENGRFLNHHFEVLS